jgi:hypothetical protein
MKNIGLKLLTKDGQSINGNYGRIVYPDTGKWINVPGNGAYVAIEGGLTSGGCGPLLAVIEYDPESSVRCNAPSGVRCYRRVRRVPELEPSARAECDKARAEYEKTLVELNKAGTEWVAREVQRP